MSYKWHKFDCDAFLLLQFGNKPKIVKYWVGKLRYKYYTYFLGGLKIISACSGKEKKRVPPKNFKNKIICSALAMYYSHMWNQLTNRQTKDKEKLRKIFTSLDELVCEGVASTVQILTICC